MITIERPSERPRPNVAPSGVQVNHSKECHNNIVYNSTEYGDVLGCFFVATKMPVCNWLMLVKRGDLIAD